MKTTDGWILVMEDPGSHLYQEITKVSLNTVVETVDYSKALFFLKEKKLPELVIFNLDHQQDLVKSLLQTFAANAPQTYWVLSGGDVGSEDLIGFLRLGLNDFLKQPLDKKEWGELLDRRREWGMKCSQIGSKETHRVISFFSCKGGVGQSLCAVNLAVELARLKIGKVMLADFVLQHGNIAELLDLVPQYTLHDLSQNLDRLDSTLIEHSVEKHSTGLFVLPCPKHPEESEILSIKEMEGTLKVLKDSFPYLVLDVGHELNPTTLSCLDGSDIIFLLTTPELPSLCNTRTALETFQRIGYKQDKIRIVLNRWRIKGGVDEVSIEKHLGQTISYKLPDDPPLVTEAINQGVTLREIRSGAELAKGFQKLAEQMKTGVKKEAPK